MTSIKLSNGSQGKFTRRQFIYTTAIAGTAALTSYGADSPRRISANDKLNIGVVGAGAGGKGESDTNLCAGENIVALCDVDEKRTAGPLKRHPGAKYYQDWRQMLEKEKSL